MINRMRRWVRKYMREIVLGISLAIFVGIAIGLAFAYSLIRIEDLFVSCLLKSLLVISGISALVSIFWWKIAVYIPITAIQQRIHPEYGISAEIKGVKQGESFVETDNLDKPIQMTNDNMIVNLTSELSFDVSFVSLSGQLKVNGQETTMALINKNDIILLKRSSKLIPWAIHGFVSRGVLLNYGEGRNHYIVKFEGIDTKGRRYPFEATVSESELGNIIG